ncbi:unnamed protein product [Somion occarium]|uniref:Protein SMG7 n=1 Tax=Somion occarium TaxID=3059160 RepID=A0ABP1DP65_9APHY
MSDAAAQVAREAKGLQQGLKELLKTRDILDKDIDIQRKNLRRQYLRLLLVHPYAKESKDAETHLWMQTSYSLISIYKQRISALDRAIYGPPRQAPQSQQPQQRNVVEYRKLLQRFRQFLADEEKFWTQLIIRLRRNFAIDNAQPALAALGILTDQEPPPQPQPQDGTTPRRNQFQFPSESDEVIPELLPTSAAQRESRLAIFSKALVCLGDIARYKEQYNESGGRPRAGHEDGPPAVPPAGRGRGRRGGAPPTALPILSRLRNYDRAILCYDQARLLTPHDGNPSHQLAIIASYQKDIFTSLMHYYRALCVRQPYETASENMGSVLHRALDQWKVKQAKGVVEDLSPFETPNAPRVRVENIKERIIILHAQWRFGGNDAESLSEQVIRNFHSLLSDRILPVEIINKVIVLAEGALWKHRMIRPTSHNEKRNPRSPLTESRMATHLLGIHRVLLDVGRTLPALRMSGKWIRANTRYLSQARDSQDPDAGVNNMHAPKSRRTRDGRGVNQKEKGNPVIIKALRQFWEDYTKFMNTLLSAFPADNLPVLRAPLEEDIEMSGFLPLRKYMLGETRQPTASQGDVKAVTNAPQPSVRGREEVHPNEEQLMRIADILIDAKAVAEDEVTPVTFDGHRFVLKPMELAKAVSADVDATDSTILQADGNEDSAAHLQAQEEARSDVDDDMMSRTETDIVGDAFRQVLDSDEDEEQILYPRPAPSPEPLAGVHSIGPTSPHSISPVSPLSPRSPPFTPQRVQPVSPPQQSLKSSAPSPPMPGAPTPSGTTAKDLLNDALRRGAAALTPSTHKRLPSNPMFFGTGPTIWSTTTESDSLKYTSAPSTTQIPSDSINHTSPFQHHESPPVPSQPSWSRLTSSQPAPSSFIGASSPWNQGLQSLPGLGPIGHQRAGSQSLYTSRPQPFTPQTQSQQYEPRSLPPPVGDPFSMPHSLHQDVNPPAYSDTIYSASPSSAFYRQENRDVFSSPYTSNGGGRTEQRAFPAPFLPTSSIWSNPG